MFLIFHSKCFTYCIISIQIDINCWHQNVLIVHGKSCLVGHGHNMQGAHACQGSQRMNERCNKIENMCIYITETT